MADSDIALQEKIRLDNSPPIARCNRKEENRQNWSNEREFVLACIGNAVGLGNLWRFPYLCYSSGGGAFLLPYLLMLVLCGIPLLYMEVGLGQLVRKGPFGAIGAVCPLLKGAGIATVILSFLLCTYYNVILSWALYYMGSSVSSSLPWASCNHSWNTERCWDSNSYQDNQTAPRHNNSLSPAQEFYENQVLGQSTGLEDVGKINWKLLLLLIVSWILVYVCLWRGVRWTGKVVYFTATFPYLVITMLVIRGVTLPGSYKGVVYYLKPRWELLAQPKVWVNAAAQNFNSIGIAFGSMIAFSSYCKSDSRVFRNTMVICVVNSLTSLVSGLAIFSILGYIATNQHKEVSDVVTEGPGLVFIVYPEGLATVPASQLFSVLFFLMLVCLAIDSQFASVEVVVTTLEDHGGVRMWRIVKHRQVLLLLVCLVAFLLGLPCITQGGIYYFKLIDYYSSAVSLMVIAFFEVISVTWCYGARRFANDIAELTGRAPHRYFVVCWYLLSPGFILAIMVFSWVQYQPLTYDDYEYPPWGIVLGWGLAFISLLCLPLGMIHAIVTSNVKPLFKKIHLAIRPEGLNFEVSETSFLQKQFDNSKL